MQNILQIQILYIYLDIETKQKDYKDMRVYYVSDETAKERVEFFRVSDAKRWLKERVNNGHKTKSSIINIRSNGEWESLGEISLGCNKKFVANTRATKPNY